MTLHKSLSICLAGALVLFCAMPAALGQLSLEPLPPQGQMRDAAADTARGHFFVAAYDQDAVWSLDVDTGKIATKINVGDGPAALATDGTYLAVVNRLGNSVTVIRLADLSIAATVETGDGPSAIVALGDGRFAVTNTFSDSVSLIDTRGASAASTLDTCPAVPVDLAASENYLLVIGRGAADVQFYDRRNLAPTGTVRLPEAATRVAALSGDRFVVASGGTLYLLDAGRAKVSGTKRLSVGDLAAAGHVIHVISGRTYQTLDENLALLGEQTLDTPYSAIIAVGPVVALLDPVAEKGSVYNLGALRTGATLAAEPATEPATAEPVVVEARTVPEGVSSPAPEAQPQVPVPAEPVEAVSEPLPEPLPEPKTTPESPGEPVADTASPVQTPTSTPVEPGAATGAEVGAVAEAGANAPDVIRRNPILTEGVRAPTLSRPSASPLQQLSRKTITDALVQPTEFGSTEGGFQAPDLTKDLENVKFKNAVGAAGSDVTELTGFSAELGDLHMKSDTFSQNKSTVDVHAEGNVLITQQSSSITADDIHFRLDKSGEGAAKEPKLLEGEGVNTGPALDQGRLTLKNAHIIEPTREMTADYLDYDFKTGKGELDNAKGQAGIYYFYAEKLHLHGPQTLSGENVWVTTCDRPHPHYKIRLREVELVDGQPTAGSDARLQLGKADTPLYLPRWRRGGVGGSPWNIDFDSGRQADIGYFVNVGQQYEVNPDVSLGPRLFVTEKEGVGLGTDLSYNFMDNPASRFYRTRGAAHALYTTEDRGYVHWYHRYEYSNDLVVRAQLEHWGDKDFYKDFYYDAFRSRSQPRSFANVTYRQPNYIATATLRPQTHGWFSETEQVPEATFHVLERQIAENLYFSFDTANGYYNREPRGTGGGRSANSVRLTYDWDPLPALAVTPYWELDGNYYTRDRTSANGEGSLSTTFGVTAQTRFHRTYAGRWGFSAFKHVVVPSVTYSYRSNTSVDPLDVPQYDPLDQIFGRSRIESKLSNIFYGRDAETGEVWQVARVTLYQGNDLSNETRATEDYEAEVDVRPRPWWGLQVVGERQVTSGEDNSLDKYSIARNFPGLYARVNDLFGRGDSSDFSGRFGDYNRILSQLYYDGAPLGKKVSGRVGFAYTETRSQVFNREALYGLGYRISDKWGFGFEHTYDFEDNNLRSQTYELRRSLHCWETAIRFRDRESGFDINFEFNIKAFPGSRLKL